jgi:hypothetical protein
LATPLLGLAAALTALLLVQLQPTGPAQTWSWPGVANAQVLERTVPLRIARNRSGGVLVFAPVYINQQGPFYFALDTGASHTVVDEQLANRLGLKETGLTGNVQGIAGAATARTVRIESWRLDQVDLSPRAAVRIDLPEPAGRDPFSILSGAEPLQEGPQGLIGSDLLSSFGTIAIDYEAAQLKLQGR